MALAADSEKITFIKNRPALAPPDDLMDVDTSTADVCGETVMLRENWARFTCRPLLEKSLHKGSTFFILFRCFL